jgi:hypothetical protein
MMMFQYYNSRRAAQLYTDDELSGFFSSLGKGLKKVGKVVAKSGVAGMIPGVGGFIQQGLNMIPTGGGGNKDMDKKCSNPKKAKKKDCVQYLEQKKQQEEAIAQAKQREDMQLQLLTRLAEKQDSGGGTIAGIEPKYLIIGGVALFAMMIIMNNRN